MSDYLIGLAVNSTIILVVTAFLWWRYCRTVARPQQLRALQYRLFAVRDRAVRLVAEGVVSEDDPEFQQWYALFNVSACSAALGQFTNGLSFVLQLLRNAKPPTPEETRNLASLPLEMQKLIADYAKTLISVCWDGSAILRFTVRLAARFASFKEWLKRKKPVETARYTRWQNFTKRCAAT